MSDCIVSPDVFMQIVDRLDEFVVPYQHALETEASQRNVPLYLQGLLSHLPGKNAEDIATFVDIERQVIQDFIGEVRYQTRQDQCLEMLDTWGPQVPHGWVTGDDELGSHMRFRHELRKRGERYVLRVPCRRHGGAPTPARLRASGVHATRCPD